MTSRTRLLLAIGLTAFSLPALAGDFRLGDIAIDHAWSRPTPPGTPVGVGYMTIHNHGDQPVTLVAGETPVAEQVSIHETRMHEGLMKMQPMPEGLTVPAGETVVLKPHSYHLMLERLERPLAEGEEVPLTLQFEGLDAMDITLDVRRMDAMPAEMDHSGH
ncbi:copper chaperone PCu(A)C [Marinobacter bryozoorum]|uniref:copper chaperone PCu(A)C n=1 Tax=Marinobacter bryozoorum TaxID=256324 RepID=UPI0020063FDB|nr:copper chaperone PCu(A)C [Marinobacter bryozoorum]MCK7545491.1 copper chaperone PCu(A)C [Marinobacter bryozoorum]